MENNDHSLGFDKLLGNPKITESSFKESVVSLYTNLTNNNTESVKQAYKEYIEIVSSEYSPVDVIDDKTGEVLFWAPPLKYKPDMVNVDIHRIVKEMDIYKKRQPKALPKMAEVALMNINKKPTMPQKDIDQWNMIFAKYGLVKSKPESSNMANVNISKETDEDDEW